MLSKKKKIFVLVAMVLLLVVTGYLNVALNKSDSELPASTTTANFFTTSRADKISSRNYQLEIYDSIIASSTDEVEVANAKAERNKIAAKIETETVLEGMIAATGYEDVIVTSANDGYTVYVKSASGINSDEVAKILSILVSETGALAKNIKVTSVA